jgi:hypothetical protein
MASIALAASMSSCVSFGDRHRSGTAGGLIARRTSLCPYSYFTRNVLDCGYPLSSAGVPACNALESIGRILYIAASVAFGAITPVPTRLFRAASNDVLLVHSLTSIRWESLDGDFVHAQRQSRHDRR